MQHFSDISKMELSSLYSSLIIVFVTWVFSSQLRSYWRLQRYNSDAPLVGNSWWETLTWRGLSKKQILVDAYRKVCLASLFPLSFSRLVLYEIVELDIKDNFKELF